MEEVLINNNGKYGIEALIAATKAANRIYDLVKAVWIDDPGWQTNDWFDLINGGPALAIAMTNVARKSGDLGKEITDLSEAEKQQLLDLAGERVQDTRYLKIYDGMLNIVDGIAELRNAENPVD